MNKFFKNTIKSFTLSSALASFLLVIFVIAGLVFSFFSTVSKILLIVILCIVGLLIFLAFVTLSKFFISIDAISQNAELLAQNELNIEDILYEEASGLEMLAIAFNDMKANLLNFIDLTKSNIITISDAIDNVSRSMSSSYTGNQQITANIGNVADKAQEQALLMDDTMSKIDEVKNRIENITNNIKEVEKSVEKTVHATTVGVKNLDDYYQQVNIISDNLNNTSEYIEKLDSDITQIDKIGKFIVKTSDQLKLLGLNASVEAAKAGESGKGFAVVAHEMNSLSTATKQSMGQINTILQNIAGSSAFVKNSINKCVENYNDSKDIFLSIKKSFNIINNNAGVLESDMKKVYTDVSLINSNTQEINQKSLLLHNVSGEISYKTQEVAAVAQESLTQLEEINLQTSSLTNMLAGIDNLIKKFHTSVVPIEGDSNKQLRITIISPLDNEFWFALRQGIMYAKKELSEKNVVIDYIGIKEDVGTQITMSFKKAIENGVDGVIVPGFDPELVELIEEAQNKNIEVMIYNFSVLKKSDNFVYCGPELSTTGATAVRNIVKALNGEGEIAICLAGINTHINEVERKTTLAEIRKYRGLKVVSELKCCDNIDQSYSATKDLLRQNPNLQGMIINGIGLTGVVKAVEELGFIGKISIICFSFNKEIAEYIRKGIIYAAVVHDIFSQGHDPVIHLFNILVTGQKPEIRNIGTRIGIIDKNNVDDFD